MLKLKKIFLFGIIFLGLVTSTLVFSAQKDLLILFSDGGGLTKSVVLYDYNEWYLSKFDNPKNITTLLKEGWSLLQVMPVNAKQHYWIFEKH